MTSSLSIGRGNLSDQAQASGEAAESIWLPPPPNPCFESTLRDARAGHIHVRGGTMKPATGATPLIALDAVAIDTETTGLDTAKARIVQIGALAISRGHIREGEPLDLLVDPGIAIPSASSRIHGVTNAMVRNAPDFAAAADLLRGFVHGRVLIGHSIGFDLAILEQESKRAGIPWHKPRSLCVRLLAGVAKPDLPDYSLDAIAAWLGIAITGRHSALGDAT